MTKKPMTPSEAWFGLVLLNVIIPAVFVFYWNVLDVSGAVGLGTVNYLTAVGVYMAGSIVSGSIALAAFGWIRTYKPNYDVLRPQ